MQCDGNKIAGHCESKMWHSFHMLSTNSLCLKCGGSFMKSQQSFGSI